MIHKTLHEKLNILINRNPTKYSGVNPDAAEVYADPAPHVAQVVLLWLQIR